MSELPAKLAAHFFSAGDESRGVAGTSSENLLGNFAAGEAAHGVQDLADGVTGAGADVKGCGFQGVDILQSAKVGSRNIQDVNVVADACAVGGRIVIAKDFDVRRSTLHGLQDPRDQMRFVAVRFSAVARGTGYIEIAQRNIT